MVESILLRDEFINRLKADRAELVKALRSVVRLSTAAPRAKVTQAYAEAEAILEKYPEA
jgi:hypothetical protein